MRTIQRPSPALVISIIALIVAVGGSTFAFATFESKQVKKIAAKVVKKLAPKLSVLHSTSADSATNATSATRALGAPPTGAAGGDLSGFYPNPEIGTAKVTATKLADNSVTTTKIQDGQVRAADLGTIVTATNTLSNLLNNENGTIIATCPAGTVVISGGGQPTFFGVETTSSLKSGNGWEYQARNNSGLTTSLTAFAYCLSG
jgi:hypothetical protein